MPNPLGQLMDTSWVDAPTDPNEVAALRIRKSVHRNGRQETFPMQAGGPFEQTANAMFGPPPNDVLMAQTDPRSALGRFIASFGRNSAPTRLADQAPIGVLRGQQAAEQSALENAAHWSRLEQAGWPGMTKTAPQPQLPSPSPMDARPSGTMFPSYEAFAQGAEQGVTGPANYASFQRIPREMIELRGEPYSALWHHDVGHNLGYAPQDIARFVRDQHATPQAAFRQLIKDAARHGAPKPASQATRAKMDEFKNPNDQPELGEILGSVIERNPAMQDLTATEAIRRRMQELGR